jgi:hypothetical protein
MSLREGTGLQQAILKLTTVSKSKQHASRNNLSAKELPRNFASPTLDSAAIDFSADEDCTSMERYRNFASNKHIKEKYVVLQSIAQGSFL